MKKIKKILKYSLFLFIIFFILTIFPLVTFNKKINRNALPSSYQKGVYHIHTNFSDGNGDLEDVSAAAGETGSDFIILTDHGNPNLSSTSSTLWKNDILIIGGSELSLNAGHLAVMGYKTNPFLFPPEAQESLQDINRNGGVSFISHPFDKKIPWTNWQVKKFNGLEVLSCYSAAKKAGLLKIFTFPLQYIFNKDYALMNLLYYPVENISKWNKLNTEGNYSGIYALDAHANIKISSKINLNIPSYTAMFRILTVYVKTKKRLQRDPHTSAGIVINSIKAGNFFNCIEALAAANGFDSYFVTLENNITLQMGEETTAYRGQLVLNVPFSFGTSVKIFKDGKLYREILNNYKKSLVVDINKPGVYRSEIYLADSKFDYLPWIMTNPFFLGRQKKSKVPVPEDIKSFELLFKGKNYFKIEKNSDSSGEVTYREKDGQFITELEYKLIKGEKKDFWVSLASRKTYNLTDYKGIILEAKSDRDMRYWFEIRTENKQKKYWYRHSFFAAKNWNKIKIPFKNFHLPAGQTRKIDLAKIYALFISINNAITYKGTSGKLFLKNIGVYK